ncbi:uncharacterized protein LOC118446218 isoform X1 [Vespa mandarinia]|uniref:uncharacterized protein LOC118446218 isoform X1 n=1 Tax=Vespa mandarinia TaxID=7446 RepID=UPI00160798B1|nr:uncharacterized protein LOC118446218 isoform X1 [Vespa mandarinia]
MSVFTADDRILLEEIVEASTEEHEAELCGSIEKVEESSVTSVAAVEAADTQQQQQQQQSKSNTVTARRVGGQNVASGNTGAGGGNNVGRVTPRSHMEQEKRMRREIANSNERRRMQSINAGFQSLRTLLPHHEGEKLSKNSRPSASQPASYGLSPLL